MCYSHAAMKTNLRKRINSALSKLPSYASSIPVQSILDIVKANGFDAICEDGSPFSAIFCGHNGSCSILICDTVTRAIQREAIQLQWWGDREHGRKGQVETNCYVM